MATTDESEKAKEKEQDVLLALFQAYLEDMGRIGARHETLRQFYVSVISALFVFLAMAGKEGLFEEVRDAVLVVVALVGIIICVSWFLHMCSFASLFSAKRATLRSIEARLPFQLFATEEREREGKWDYIHLTTVDRIVAVGFALLFVALLFYKVNERSAAPSPTRTAAPTSRPQARAHSETVTVGMKSDRRRV